MTLDRDVIAREGAVFLTERSMNCADAVSWPIGDFLPGAGPWRLITQKWGSGAHSVIGRALAVDLDRKNLKKADS
jgi:hypothetical protein